MTRWRQVASRSRSRSTKTPPSLSQASSCHRGVLQDSPARAGRRRSSSDPCRTAGVVHTVRTSSPRSDRFGRCARPCGCPSVSFVKAVMSASDFASWYAAADDGERTSFGEVVRRLAIAGEVGRTLGERLAVRLRPLTQDRLGDLSTAHPVGVAADGEVRSPSSSECFRLTCSTPAARC